MTIDWRTLAFLVSLIIGLLSFYLYQKGIFKGVTKPHPFSWLVWLITLVIATLGIDIGEGDGENKFASLYYTIYTVTAAVTFVRTIRVHAFSSVEAQDYIWLALALAAVPAWLLAGPLLAVLIVTLIDAIGYMMTIKKVYYAPTSEPKLAWALAIASQMIVYLLMEDFNLLTMLYPAVTTIAGIVIVLIAVFRRKQLQI